MSATAPANSEKPNGPRSRKGAETRARLVEGDLDCSFDLGVEQLTRLFPNALRLTD